MSYYRMSYHEFSDFLKVILSPSLNDFCGDKKGRRWHERHSNTWSSLMIENVKAKLKPFLESDRAYLYRSRVTFLRRVRHSLNNFTWRSNGVRNSIQTVSDDIA